MNRTFLQTSTHIISLCLLFVFFNQTILLAVEYEGYYNYVSTFPSEDENLDSDECQGVTHDGEYWYFPRNNVSYIHFIGDIPFPFDGSSVIKVPFSLALNFESGCGQNGVSCNKIEYLNKEDIAQYNHIGDISFFRYIDEDGGEHKFLLVPFEHTDDRPIPAIGLYDAETLRYITQAKLPSHVNGFASYVAIDPDGYVYTGRANRDSECVYCVNKYYVNWENVVKNDLFYLEFIEKFPLFLEDGVTTAEIAPAGADFSTSGKLFYTSSTWGIDVFDMITYRRIRRVYYNGICHPEVGCFPIDEAEGITVLDVEQLPLSQRPPNVPGQLHMIRLSNELNTDDIDFLHFTNKVYVDSAYSGSGDGRPDSPYQNAVDANEALWDGGIMSIETGSYPESITINKKIRMEATGGTVMIGDP